MRDAKWADLLRQANNGHRDAYIAFLKQVAPVLRGVIQARSGGRHEDCEDILQNVLIAIHEKRHTWRENEPVSAWLYAIARYKTIDALRKSGRSRTTAFDGEEAQVVDDNVIDPTAARDLDVLLTRLDDTSAAIVRQIKLQGLTAEEVGAQLNMTPGAVRVALHRAMTRLSAAVAEDDPETANQKAPT